MNLPRIALSAACLALPAVVGGGAAAQPADGSRLIQVPPGAVVLILGGQNAASAETTSGIPLPITQLIAQQQAMMQRIMADMNTLFPPLPDPERLIDAALQAAGQPGMGVRPDLAMTAISGTSIAGPSVAGGHGICGESISYVFTGNGAPPQVHVTRYGDACRTSAPDGVQGVTEPPRTAPKPQPRVLEVGYPPHQVAARVPSRT